MLPCCYDICENSDSIVAVNLNEDVWPFESPQWTSDNKLVLLSETNDIRSLPDLTLAEIIENSGKFPVPFPIESVRCKTLKEKESSDLLEKNINSTYPLIHESALHLCSTFLSYQIQYGNTDFYKNMSLTQFIDRLLSKRAVVFVGVLDHYMLLDGTEGFEGWESVGTPEEKTPLLLENCLSYGEMKLSALLSVSSHTCFINNGNRRNRGIPATDMTQIEQNGVIVGLIGTRLGKKNVMECQEIVKSVKQNTLKNGYGRKCNSLQRKFLEFYGDICATYTEMLPLLKTNSDRYVKGDDGIYFDKLMYTRRIALSIDTLLIEANDRAKKQNTAAYVHVVGIGLGVWRICSEQNQLFADTCARRLEFFQDQLANISDVCLAYIGVNTLGSYKDGDKIGRITVHITNKNPQEKLTGDNEGKLLVISYAWDSNALPGNEFWHGSLDTSSDPAAACSTQVTELHNYHINGKVRGENLRVATLKHGVMSLEEYQQLHKDD